MKGKLRLLWLDLCDWFAEDPSRVNDVLAAAGVLIVAGGVWLVYPPAAVILVGLAVLGVGVLGAKVWAGRRRREEQDKARWGE